MKKQFITIAMYILVLSLLISGCGPGQLLGPTITPSPTLTPIPTSTPTPTPVPVESILLSNGFKLLKENACSDGPCTSYAIEDILMYVTYYKKGTLIIERILFLAEDNEKQGEIQKKILYALYPEDVANAVMGGQAVQQDGKTELPYEGTIDVYKYGAYLEPVGMQDPFTGNEILKMVVFVIPIE